MAGDGGETGVKKDPLVKPVYFWIRFLCGGMFAATISKEYSPYSAFQLSIAGMVLGLIAAGCWEAYWRRQEGA